MTTASIQRVDKNAELEIRDLIERWARAVRERDIEGIRANHHPDILMFDVPPPFLSRGLDAYMASWQLFYDHTPSLVDFNFEEVEVTSGTDVAFATAKGKCTYINREGRPEPLDFRLTMGLKKINGDWRILHEHHSVPAN